MFINAFIIIKALSRFVGWYSFWSDGYTFNKIWSQQCFFKFYRKLNKNFLRSFFFIQCSEETSVYSWFPMSLSLIYKSKKTKKQSLKSIRSDPIMTKSGSVADLMMTLFEKYSEIYNVKIKSFISSLLYTKLFSD